MIAEPEWAERHIDLGVGRIGEAMRKLIENI